MSFIFFLEYAKWKDEKIVEANGALAAGKAVFQEFLCRSIGFNGRIKDTVWSRES